MVSEDRSKADSEERKYQRRDERKADPPGHYMKERDARILEAVHRYRVLTVDQIHRIAFWDAKRQCYPNKSTVYTRLNRLYHNGYLDRDFLEGNGSIQNRKMLHVLAEKGAAYLLEQRGYETVNWHQYDNRIGIEHIQHLLFTNEFMSRFEEGCHRHPDLELLHFTDERQLKADYDRVRINVSDNPQRPVYREQAVLFDAHIIYRQRDKRRHLFLESDHLSHTAGLWQRSDKPTRSYRDKIMAVIAGRSLIEARFGTRGYRLLTVTPSERRTANLHEVATRAGGLNIFWFATLDDDKLTAHSLFYEPVWWVCGQDEPDILTGDPNL